MNTLQSNASALTKRQDMKTIFICWLAYATAYIGRLNYSAVLVAVLEDLSAPKNEAGLVSSFFFFAYGIGQLVNGILCKHYNSKTAVFTSLTVSSAINIAMGFLSDITVMKYLWLVNGAVQSVLWCSIIKTVSENVSEKMFDRAVLVMSTPNVVGTVIVYGASALLVNIGKWRLIFIFASACMLVAAVLWFILYRKPVNEGMKTPIQQSTKQTSKVGLAVCLPPVMFAALAGIANGFIKDGVNTWVTSVLHEQFGVSQAFSIMLSLALPLVGVPGAFLVVKLNKKIPSHTTLNFALYLATVLFCLLLYVSMEKLYFIPSMTCFVLISCVMSMINNVVTSIFPLSFRGVADAGFSAGLLNTFCYLGSTVSTYTLGSVAQKSGWDTVFLLMLYVALAAGAVCGAGFAVNLLKGERIYPRTSK